MNGMNLYVKTAHEIPKHRMDLAFSTIIGGNYQFLWNGTFGTLVLDQPQTQFVNLKLSFDALNADLMDDLTMVIVPRHEKKIAELVRSSTRIGLYHFTQELPRLLHENPLIRDELMTFTDEVSEDVLQTIQTYLELNMSVNLVAKTMYTHRNTVNYRISRFIELTGIDIRATTNGYYVYTLITWQTMSDYNKM